MARADLLCDLIKYGLIHDDKRFLQTAEAACAEERDKQHTVLADRIEKIIRTANASSRMASKSLTSVVRSTGLGAQSLFVEKTPERRIDDLVLPQHVRTM